MPAQYAGQNHFLDNLLDNLSMVAGVVLRRLLGVRIAVLTAVDDNDLGLLLSAYQAAALRLKSLGSSGVASDIHLELALVTLAVHLGFSMAVPGREVLLIKAPHCSNAELAILSTDRSGLQLRCSRRQSQHAPVREEAVAASSFAHSLGSVQSAHQMEWSPWRLGVAVRPRRW